MKTKVLDLKKILVLTFVMALSVSLSAFSQSEGNAVVIKGGYQTEKEMGGLGVEGRIGLVKNLRLSPDLIFLFPKDNVTGLDADANLELSFPVSSEVSLYPLAGLNMSNGRFSKDDYHNEWTNWGFNMGAGMDYNLTSKSFLNVSFRYTFNKTDFASFFVGYGIRL